MPDLGSTIRTAVKRLSAMLRRIGSALVWLAAPVISSTQGVWDRTDVRAAVTKALAVGGLTWTGIKTAAHDPDFIGAMVVVCLSIAAGVHEAYLRKQNGTPADQSQHQPPPAPGA